jgi:hypothetical protein
MYICGERGRGGEGEEGREGRILFLKCSFLPALVRGTVLRNGPGTEETPFRSK